ncbi:hypothetical protein [Microbacterium sp.]
MPRFRSSISGVAVSVSEETVELLDSEWEPFDDETKKARGARVSKSEN